MTTGSCDGINLVRTAHEFEIALQTTPHFSLFSEPTEMKWMKLADVATELYNPREDINGCSKNLIKFQGSSNAAIRPM